MTTIEEMMVLATTAIEALDDATLALAAASGAIPDQSPALPAAIEARQAARRTYAQLSAQLRAARWGR